MCKVPIPPNPTGHLGFVPRWARKGKVCLILTLSVLEEPRFLGLPQAMQKEPRTKAQELV